MTLWGGGGMGGDGRSRGSQASRRQLRARCRPAPGRRCYLWSGLRKRGVSDVWGDFSMTDTGRNLPPQQGPKSFEQRVERPMAGGGDAASRALDDGGRAGGQRAGGRADGQATGRRTGREATRSGRKDERDGDAIECWMYCDVCVCVLLVSCVVCRVSCVVRAWMRGCCDGRPTDGEREMLAS